MTGLSPFLSLKMSLPVRKTLLKTAAKVPASRLPEGNGSFHGQRCRQRLMREGLLGCPGVHFCGHSHVEGRGRPLRTAHRQAPILRTAAEVDLLSRNPAKAAERGIRPIDRASDIHFIHVRSKHEKALPVIITHGWPGPSSSSSSSSSRSRIRRRMVALRPTRSMWSFPRCRATASRGSPPPPAAGRSASPEPGRC
jgi:hypothetical protein